jgi:hypothetical protein
MTDARERAGPTRLEVHDRTCSRDPWRAISMLPLIAFTFRESEFAGERGKS